MLQFRLADLRDEDAYYLDHAQDDGEITPGAYATLMLCGDRDEIGAILDKPRPGRGWDWTRKVTCLELEAAAIRAVDAMPERLQSAMIAVSLCRAEKTIGDLTYFLASWNYEDSTVGGAGEPYRLYPRHRRDMTPTPRAARTLYAPSSIRRYVARERQVVPHARDLWRRWQHLPWPGSLEDGVPVLDLINQQSREMRARVEAGYRAIETRVRGDSRRMVSRPERRVLARAASTAVTVLGRSTVSDFISGKPARIEARDFDFEIMRRRAITANGHGSLNIAICDKTGDQLAHLCCYFREINALDQLTAIALHAMSGNEAEVLATGNLYSVTPAGSRHPIILEHKKAKPPQSEILSHRDLLRREIDAYAARTQPLYRDAVGEAVWGRAWAKVQRLAAALPPVFATNGPSDATEGLAA